MPTVREWVRFFYPYIEDGDDPRFVPEQDLEMAISVAAAYRPECLTEDRQNQAQAHYAVYVTEFIARQKANVTKKTTTPTVAGPIVEKQEGDTRVKYATSASENTTITQVKSNLTGPGTAYSAWQALWEICTPVLEEGQKPVRRGGIMTAYG
jgi:hypothetical protein